LFLASLPLTTARLAAKSSACVKDDLKHRMKLQNKLAGVCVDMCKEVGAFPKCTCPDFVAPDSTPGVMTWPELLEHMDNLSEWGHGELKSWRSQASFVSLHEQGAQSEEACLAEDLQHRTQVQNKLAGVCVDMCKEVGAFPKCTCPNFVAPDSTPGVMTWDELLEHMDNLSEWGHGELKRWNQQASQLQINEHGAQTEKACLAEDLKHRMQLQNKLAGVCVDMCKEVGAFPKCTCPDFVAPDSTPGVMTWPELLEHMDNLSDWGHGELKAWRAQASLLQVDSCMAEDLKHRMQVQNKLAGVCVDMCKEVGAFPKCECPDFVAPNSNWATGLRSWPELLDHMDNLSEWGHGEIKKWTKQAAK